MYASGKMRTVETISGLVGREKEWWRGEFKYDIFDIL
jgi:hypothetical protein